ncbi:MAG TPA: glycoside hydrolase family 31 protein [Paludibacteraceae bacterium]|nr:glycoside hydrolase family 31 protein [Paludibacteraceae bacterium]
MKRFKLFLLLLIATLTGCNHAFCQKIADGIIFPVLSDSHTGVKKIRIQVVSDKIIRVTATAGNKFSGVKSLIIVPQPKEKKKFNVTENKYQVSLSTDSLKLKIVKKTGEITFLNKQGKVLLKENSGGGKSFVPIQVEGTRGYSVRQVFDSPEKEAFYGLGQHQSDEFNYKGKNESLFQYNTKVSVPFVVSSNNYGILWDNYSLSKFGDCREYEQLNQFKLSDTNGNPGGLTAVYSKKDNSVVPIIRVEPLINYENLSLIKNFPQNFDLNNSKVTWNGQLEADKSGDFHFILHYAGYVKVYFNNIPVVTERWRTAWNPNDFKFKYNLRAGEKIPVRIEWEPDGAVSYISLKALSPLAHQEQNKLSLWSEMADEIDYYFVYGSTMDDIISGYRKLTGKSQIMPEWAMGFWQSRERYKTQHELLTTLSEFRKRNIPIDNIVQDWNYWPETEWGSHKFDPQRFPDPVGLVDSVHKMNGHIMISVWPKFYTTTDNYKAFDKNGWMYQKAVKDSIRDWVGPGYVGSFYDAYAEGARKLFWKQMKGSLYDKGFDAWWMDASEPNVQDNTDIDYRKKLCGPTALGPSTKYFNAYALMNAEAIYDGQRSVDPDKRVFLLTRSGFAGLQRYSTATWSGDIGTRWEDMKAQISAGLNFALSGIPYWTMDIGGFCTEKRYENAQRLFDQTGTEDNDLKEWRELNTRWYQFGAFAPLYRAHGQFPLREIFNIAPENHPAYQSILYYSKLRYRLMPYIYSLAGMTHFNDYTIMRALVMDYGKDTVVNNISDQYMFGNALMVCPVYEYKAVKREVYFPNTTGWYDFYTGKHVQGGTHMQTDAPYSHMPVFVPEGAIIPFGPDIQFTREKKPESITLYVYGGKNGSFTLYEDEGTNYNYEKGKYSMITFTYDEKNGFLEIGNRTGSFTGMLENREFNVVFVDKATPKSCNPDTVGMKVKYTGQKLTLKLR